jgi:hypothetical protein
MEATERNLSRRNFLRKGSLFVPAAAAGAALLTAPKPAKADVVWGNMLGVQWPYVGWGDCGYCLQGNQPPAVRLDITGANGQMYWQNTVNMDAWWGSYFNWANLPQVLEDGYTLPQFLENGYALYQSGVPDAINQAAWNYGVNIDPAYGTPWNYCLSVLGWIQQNYLYSTTFGDSWNTMVSYANQRSQGYFPDAIHNPWLVVGGMAIAFSGVAGMFLPGVGWAPGAAMIAIGLGFMRLGA